MKRSNRDVEEVGDAKCDMVAAPQPYEYDSRLDHRRFKPPITVVTLTLNSRMFTCCHWNCQCYRLDCLLDISGSVQYSLAYAKSRKSGFTDTAE